MSLHVNLNYLQSMSQWDICLEIMSLDGSIVLLMLKFDL